MKGITIGVDEGVAIIARPHAAWVRGTTTKLASAVTRWTW